MKKELKCFSAHLKMYQVILILTFTEKYEKRPKDALSELSLYICMRRSLQIVVLAFNSGIHTKQWVVSLFLIVFFCTKSSDTWALAP